jgi:hypothetical protein
LSRTDNRTVGEGRAAASSYGSPNNGCTGFGIQILHATDVDIYHNTIDAITDEGFRAGPANLTGRADTNIDVWNNIIGNTKPLCLYLGGRQSRPGICWRPQRIRNTQGDQKQFKYNGTSITLGDWQKKDGSSSLLVADKNSLVADPRFVPGAGLTDDYFTECGSSARDRAKRDS